MAAQRNGFGKRGQVSYPPNGTPPPTAPEAPTAGLPKWAIGAAAAVALFALVTSTGLSGGGLLGGLLGGFLANKMMNSANPQSAAKTVAHGGDAGTASRQASTSPVRSAEVSRGGFGTTALSGGSSSSGG